MQNILSRDTENGLTLPASLYTALPTHLLSFSPLKAIFLSLFQQITSCDICSYWHTTRVFQLACQWQDCSCPYSACRCLFLIWIPSFPFLQAQRWQEGLNSLSAVRRRSWAFQEGPALFSTALGVRLCRNLEFVISRTRESPWDLVPEPRRQGEDLRRYLFVRT